MTTPTDKNGPAIAQQPAPGAYLCESTARNADYWLNGAAAQSSPEQADLCYRQAINAWKNLAYGLARSAHYYHLQGTGQLSASVDRKHDQDCNLMRDDHQRLEGCNCSLRDRMQFVDQVYMAVRARAEGSDWKRGEESLADWVSRRLRVVPSHVAPLVQTMRDAAEDYKRSGLDEECAALVAPSSNASHVEPLAQELKTRHSGAEVSAQAKAPPANEQPRTYREQREEEEAREAGEAAAKEAFGDFGKHLTPRSSIAATGFATGGHDTSVLPPVAAAPSSIGPGDGMAAGRFHCACVFSRPTDFSEAVLVDECSYHARRRGEAEQSATEPRKLLAKARDELRVIASYADDESTNTGLRLTAHAYGRVIAEIDAYLNRSDGTATNG